MVLRLHNRLPLNAEPGIRLDGRLQFQWTTGGAAITHVRLVIWHDAACTWVLWDSLWRPLLAGAVGDGWLDLWLDLIWSIASTGGLTPSTDYWWQVQDRGSGGDSTLSAATKFTTEAAELSGSTWRGSQ